jgi:N-acetylglucosaminyl-diphospho-decaprenol L-rhamnosyltransferase
VSRDVEVIIVNYNAREELLRCLASLEEAKPASLARITVVDNASTDGSVPAVAESWPAVHAIQMPANAGFGAANNVALRASEAEFVLFLNSDTIVGVGAVDALLGRLRSRGAVAAGPKLVDEAGRPEISHGRMLTPWTEFVQRRRVRRAASDSPWARRSVERLVATERIVDWVSGACLLVKRDAALRAGGFDERYFLYEEDVDFCAALRAQGGTILFTPVATVTHARGRSVARASDPADPSHYDRSHLKFYEKHAPGWAPWLRRWQRLRGRGIE